MAYSMIDVLRALLRNRGQKLFAISNLVESRGKLGQICRLRHVLDAIIPPIHPHLVLKCQTLYCAQGSHVIRHLPILLYFPDVSDPVWPWISYRLLVVS